MAYFEDLQPRTLFPGASKGGFRGPIRAALEVDEARTVVIEVVRRAIAAAPWWWDRLHEQIK